MGEGWIKTPEATAAIIAAIVAIILAVGQGLSSWQAQRRNNAIMLIQLMSSERLHNARRTTSALLRHDSSHNLDLALTRGVKNAKQEVGPSHQDIVVNVSIVIGFYELVYGLMRSWAVDRKMLRVAFGQRTAFFYEYLYLKYGGDRTSEWCFALDKIGKLECICDKHALAHFALDRKAQSRLSKSTDVSMPPDGEG
jgi:hypothetical protein